MKPKAKTYKFKLYEEDLSNELLIRKIRKAISTLPVAYFSFVVVELFKENTNFGIPFFQTTHHRDFKKTQYYTIEVRVDSELNGQRTWDIYKKDMQTKQQVLQLFEEICVKRIAIDLVNWETSGINSHKSAPKDNKSDFLKHLYSDYYNIEIPTKIDDIKYWESLRYFINHSDNYKADKLVALADQYCKNGQYTKAKEIYERVTFEPNATYKFADMIMSGKLGKPDYKLAYEYYNHTCLIDDINYFGAKIEIAKMHRDGKYFKPNYLIYKKIIKDIEQEYSKCGGIYPYLDELYYELSLIEQADSNTEQSLNYCFKARHWAKEYLTYGNDENNILNAKRILKLLYTFTEFNNSDTDFFDLLYIMDSPFKIVFAYNNSIYCIESFLEKGYLIIKFNDNYYRGAVNFIMKATLGGRHFLHEADKITIIEVNNGI